MSIKTKLATGLAVASMALPSVAVLGETSQTVESLTSKVVTTVSDNEYRSEDGQSIKGHELIKDANGIPKVDEFKLGELSHQESVRFLQDVKNETDRLALEGEQSIARGEAEGNVITNKTSSKFWEYMNDNNGVGSRMISVVTAGNRVDWAGGYAFLVPFMPLFNTGQAILIYLASFSFFFFLAADLFYFVTPPLQVWVEANKDGTGFAKYGSSIISSRAKKAIRATEERGNPILHHLMSSWFTMLCFAIALLYFTANSMLTLVGPMTNLVSGLLGFK